MLTKRMRRIAKALRRDDSGNAMMLMALGMPMLIGSAGMAVDVAQWYLWRRELQYAVDQAALAGAWANADPEQAEDYVVLAGLEYQANLSYLKDKVGDPTINLADYDDGEDNSVLVTAEYSELLPFSSIVYNSQATVRVTAQANFQAATNYTTCLLALDEDADDALIIGGSASGTVTCGAGAISNSISAIRKNGNSMIQLQDLISAGGIDDGLVANGLIHEFISNLSNPFEGLTPPTDDDAQSYSCSGTSTTTVATGNYTATVTPTTETKYTYWQGKNQAQATTQVTTNLTGIYRADTSVAGTAATEYVASGTIEGSSVAGTPTTSWTGNQKNATNGNKIFEKQTVTVTKKYTNVAAEMQTVTTTTNGNAMNLQPGTYANITIGCDSFFNPGVYVITGAMDLGQNHTVTGENVMFVFTGTGTGDKFSMNSNTVVNFSGITKEQLTDDYGVAEDQADRLAGMIIYDENSTGDITINGNANITFDGILYMPERHVQFNGNSTVSATADPESCMMIASATMEISGNGTIGSFCVPTTTTAFDIGGTTISVRLVA